MLARRTKAVIRQIPAVGCFRIHRGIRAVFMLSSEKILVHD